MEYAISGKPSRSLIMPVECARINDVLTHLYVANDLNYEGGDKRFFDLGTLHIGSQGLYAATSAIAEIWITYDITLFKPRLATQVALTTPYSAHIQNLRTDNVDLNFELMFRGSTISDPKGMLTVATNNFIGMGPKGYGRRFLVSITASGNAAPETFTYPLVTAVGNYSTIETWFNSPSGFNTLGVGTEAHAVDTDVSSRTASFIWTISSNPGPGNTPSFVVTEFSGYPKSTQRIDCYVAEIGDIMLPMPVQEPVVKERFEEANKTLPPRTMTRTVSSPLPPWGGQTPRT
jgi:hypothetical protein